MKTPRRHLIPLILTTILFLAACSADVSGPPPPASPPETFATAAVPGRSCHATGELQLLWKGSGNAPAGAHGDSIRVAAAVFDIHEPDRGMPARGTFRYRVLADDGTLHREVTAAIEGATIDPAAHRVWFVGRVIADTKGCAGAPGGGHDGGCAGDTGGCSDGHDDGHDGGCSGDHEEGGCSGGGDTGGGCPDGTHEDGGCPEGSHDDGGPGGSGGPTGATGRSCRVGQMIVGKAHDAGSPGATYDGITWKWFLADDPDLPSLGDLGGWPHLCRKSITGGNLVVHVPGGPGVQSRDLAQ